MAERSSAAFEAEALALATRIVERAGGVSRPLPAIRVRPCRCGRYYPKRHAITLPLWLWDNEHRNLPRYLEWYVAHELAHAFSERQGHGIEFQAVLFALAPEAWHWETTYKPRQYAQLHRLLYPASP